MNPRSVFFFREDRPHWHCDRYMLLLLLLLLLVVDGSFQMA
jgi:hypothetical protein